MDKMKRVNHKKMENERAPKNPYQSDKETEEPDVTLNPEVTQIPPQYIEG